MSAFWHLRLKCSCTTLRQALVWDAAAQTAGRLTTACTHRIQAGRDGQDAVVTRIPHKGSQAGIHGWPRPPGALQKAM